MIDRREKILSSEEVAKILAKHFGFPEDKVELWLGDNLLMPNEFIFRYDIKNAGIHGDPPGETASPPPHRYQGGCEAFELGAALGDNPYTGEGGEQWKRGWLNSHNAK